MAEIHEIIEFSHHPHEIGIISTHFTGEETKAYRSYAIGSKIDSSN